MTKIIIGLAAVALMAVAASVALAHEDSDEGDYRFVVGFLREPAYEGEMNAVSIRVSKVSVVEEAEEEEEGHDHDGHDHGDHDHEETEGVDVNEHGALFLSPLLATGGAFEFQVADEFAGMAIPFHNHLDHDVTGVISVGETGQGGGMADRVTVSIGEVAFDPSDVRVKPGSTIVFMNDTGAAQNVTSGLMDGMDSGGGSHVEVTAPVEGLQDTLQVEVTHVPSDVSVTMGLRPVFDDPGHYVASLIPTSPGHYRFRFFGTVEGTPLVRTFDSHAGGGGFDDVQAASVIHFPEAVASAREVEGAVRGAQATAQQAQAQAMSASDSASGATTLGIAGIIVGAVGVALGGGAIFISLRRGG